MACLVVPYGAEYGASLTLSRVAHAHVSLHALMRYSPQQHPNLQPMLHTPMLARAL